MANVRIHSNKVFGQLVGELALSYVLARFALLLWTAFPSALRVGSILWYNLPWILAAIDRTWRVKMLLGLLIHALA